MTRQDLPESSPSESTCWRRINEWTESGLLIEVWLRLVEFAEEFRRVA
jgi:transposase